jgi:hypothetical protein
VVISGEKNKNSGEKCMVSVSRFATTVAGPAMCSGVSIATAGSASADGRLASAKPAIYKTFKACQTHGNKLAQKGKLTTFRCIPAPRGGYYFYFTR